MADQAFSLDDASHAMASLWAAGADYTLLRYARLAPDGPVLDVGIGEGRNALLLARLGREVEGVDVSDSAVHQCMDRARPEGLKLTATVGDVRDLVVPEERYALAIAAWVLHFVRPTEYEAIVRKLVGGLKRSGLMYLAVFTPEDPAYDRAKDRFQPAGEHTFYLKKINGYLHYFTRNEVVSPVSDLETVYLAEGRQLDFGHGDPHIHGFIEYVGRRRA